MIIPAAEWSLQKIGNGTLVTVLKDNIRNLTTNFTITEFQRGNFTEFATNQSIIAKGFARIGDTIGLIRSSEEERRYAELKAELVVQRSLLLVHQSGEKTEVINLAKEAMYKAEQEYETWKKMADRNELLYRDGHISLEEFEKSDNDLKVKKYNANMARMNFESLSTGSKPEQLNYIESSIKALEIQLAQVEEKLKSFQILSPINGNVINFRSSQANLEVVITVADHSRLVILLPIEIYQLSYIHEGQTVSLSVSPYDAEFTATIVEIDNTAQMIHNRQNVFVTAIIDEGNTLLLPGMIAEVNIWCGKVSLYEYFRRLIRVVYAN